MKYYLVLKDSFRNQYLSHCEVIEKGKDYASLLAKCVNLNANKPIIGFYYDVIDETSKSITEKSSLKDDFMRLLKSID